MPKFRSASLCSQLVRGDPLQSPNAKTPHCYITQGCERRSCNRRMQKFHTAILLKAARGDPAIAECQNPTLATLLKAARGDPAIAECQNSAVLHSDVLREEALLRSAGKRSRLATLRRSTRGGPATFGWQEESLSYTRLTRGGLHPTVQLARGEALLSSSPRSLSRSL